MRNLSRYIKLAFVSICIFLALGQAVSASSESEWLPQIPGVTSGVSNHFEINDSEYLNVSLDSSEIIDLRIESIPHMILMYIKPILAPAPIASSITIRDLKPLTTYYLYEDSHRNLTVIKSDMNGLYSYIQDISSRHLVFIKPEPSTKYISDDETGGDCVSIGIWNWITKTCTLTTDLAETIEIESNGITLDGNGHSIIKSGSMSGFGVYISNRNNVSIKNISDIKNFSYGIQLFSSGNNTITGNTVSNNQSGIYLSSSSGNTLKNNTVNSSDDSGITLSRSSSNTLEDNIVQWNYFGIYLYLLSSDNYVHNNDAFYNGIGIFLNGSSNNNIISSNVASFNNDTGIYVPTLNNTIINNYTEENVKHDLRISWGNGDPSSCNNIVYGNIGSGGYPVGFYNSRVNLDSIILSQLILCNADGSNINNVIIRGSLSIKNNGITLNHTDKSTISNTTSSENFHGITMFYSSRNIIKNNNFNDNFLRGLNITLQSSKNLVFNNSFSNNGSLSSVDDSTNILNQPLPIGGNYWSDFDSLSEGCADSDTNNICDSPYVFSGGQDNFPWILQNGWASVPPVLDGVGQYKSDSDTTVPIGGITTESWSGNPLAGIVSFVANVSDPQGDRVQLQVEVKTSSQPISWINFATSDLVNSGTRVAVSINNIPSGLYRWRARAIDSSGNTSAWQEFGANGDSADFEVKLVPLYTQVESQYNYPINPADRWDDLNYNNGIDTGTGGCGAKIRNCGCAIASTVMVMRYYDFTSRNNGAEDVNPKAFNEWLQDNNGYKNDSTIKWEKLKDYSNNIVAFNPWKSFSENDGIKTGVLNDYLKNSYPLIAYQGAVPYIDSRGQSRTTPHFIVIDNKLASTYNVKDPKWYNTKTLDDIDDAANQIKSYGGKFTSLRVIEPSGGISSNNGISLRLGSPAEFLITDPLGRKLGKDPSTGIEYAEIPESYYYKEGIGDPTGETDGQFHVSKFISIPDAINGNYDIKVIGTGGGSYTVDSSINTAGGDSHSESFMGNTRPNVVTTYDMNYDLWTPENITIEPRDKIAPTTSINITGNQNGDWYSSNVLVSLASTDDSGGVGVYKTEYSLDAGSIWQTYTGPFTPLDGLSVNILYRSEDYIGNVEIAKSIIIKVDQTPPEAKISFDLISRKVKVEGVDNLSIPTVTTMDSQNYTITDHVGHTLKINLLPVYTAQTLTNPAVVNIKVDFLQYDSGPIISLPTTNLLYKFFGSPIILLNESINVLNQFSITGVYNPVRNNTNIVAIQDGSSATEVVSGLTIIKLTTRSGNLGFEYQDEN